MLGSTLHRSPLILGDPENPPCLVLSAWLENQVSRNQSPGNWRVVSKGQSQPYFGAFAFLILYLGIDTFF